MHYKKAEKKQNQKKFILKKMGKEPNTNPKKILKQFSKWNFSKTS